MMPEKLTQSLKAEARQLGFGLCGICPAVTPAGISKFHEWLNAGYGGEMSYLADRFDAYHHPDGVMPGTRSIVMLGLDYYSEPQQPPRTGQGLISKYAWGNVDYHDLIHQKLKALKAKLLDWQPNAQVRGVVDSAPLLEREFAVLAGLGWQGKNTLLINKQRGSWFFLAALLTDLELEYDAPHATEHCGTCRACLDACPTDAFIEPNVLDATKCISYLTIELRKPIPHELRPGIQDWLFGCDVCQDVCPWNRHAQETTEDQLRPNLRANPRDLASLFEMTDEDFRAEFRRTPLWRSRRRGILRNAAIVLGNQAQSESIPALARGIQDPEPLVRGASAWALGEISTASAQQILESRRDLETDATVLEEIKQALQS